MAGTTIVANVASTTTANVTAIPWITETPLVSVVASVTVVAPVTVVVVEAMSVTLATVMQATVVTLIATTTVCTVSSSTASSVTTIASGTVIDAIVTATTVTSTTTVSRHTREEKSDPVEILKIYRETVLIGRQLDVHVTTEDSFTEGETIAIYVSRFDLLTTAMEELLAIEVDEFRKPLEVTFYGEKAQDVGGPRREFFTLILKCILDEDNQLLKKVEEGYVLLDTERNVRNRYFFGMGLICGLSMLEDGPVPCFLEEDQLEKLFSHEILTESEQLFKDGFNVLGLVDLIIQKPSLKFLLQKSAEHQITYKHLMTLLAPRFSEAGSTSRVYEERTYSRFAAYVKEVAAGRRECNVTLGLILRFVTGNETEPIFGFTNTPSLVFRDDLPWSLPRASTCTCQLTLPFGNDVPADKDTLLQRFDWAFSNTYFGYA